MKHAVKGSATHISSLGLEQIRQKGTPHSKACPLPLFHTGRHLVIVARQCTGVMQPNLKAENTRGQNRQYMSRCKQPHRPRRCPPADPLGHPAAAASGGSAAAAASGPSRRSGAARRRGHRHRGPRNRRGFAGPVAATPLRLGRGVPAAGTTRQCKGNTCTQSSLMSCMRLSLP